VRIWLSSAWPVLYYIQTGVAHKSLTFEKLAHESYFKRTKPLTR
jgi:hypothetical protein